MGNPVSVLYLDRQTARVSAALPAAGAFDAAPLEVYCTGMEWASFFISYDENAGGGAGSMQFRVEVSPDTTGATWYRTSLYDGGVLAAGADTLSAIQREYIQYTATGAALEGFVYGPIHLLGAQRIRIPCAESGQVGFPGVVEVIAMLGVTGGADG